MNTRKSLAFLLLSTLLLGGFPDFRIKTEDSPLLSDTYAWISVPSTTYDITQIEFPESFPSPEELIATPTPAPTATPTPTPTPAPTATPKPTPKPTQVPLGKSESKKPGNLTFNYPEPAPLNTKTSTYTLLVNKEYPLSSKYIPFMVEPNVEIYHKGINERRYLQPIAATALEEMFAAAEEDGLHLVLRCGFRSYRLQYSIYSWNLKTYGYYEVSRYHALAGTSEHQTGLAVDLCCEATNYQNNFDIVDTEEYAWLLENAHLYGWILRYPEDKTDITGYNFEPWHFRYVGVELATYLKENDIVLEEYYGALPTTNLLAVPEEFWEFLSEEDIALMEQDIADYEKRMEELANQPSPTPTPTPEPDVTDTPNQDENPDADLIPDSDETPDNEEPAEGNNDDDSASDDAATDDNSDNEDITDADEPDADEPTDSNDIPYKEEDSFEDIPSDDTWEEDLLISEDPLDYL